MSTEWGPWIRHNGWGCPVRNGTIVEVVCEDRFGYTMNSITTVAGGSYSSWNWEFFPELKRIIRYREKKPKGMQMLTDILEQNDAPVKKESTLLPQR